MEGGKGFSPQRRRGRGGDFGEMGDRRSEMGNSPTSICQLPSAARSALVSREEAKARRGHSPSTLGLGARKRAFLAIHGKLERVGFSEGFGCLVF